MKNGVIFSLSIAFRVGKEAFYPLQDLGPINFISLRIGNGLASDGASRFAISLAISS